MRSLSLHVGYCDLLVGNLVTGSTKYRATVDKGWLDKNGVGGDLGCEVGYEVGCMGWACFFNCLIQALSSMTSKLIRQH